MTRDLFLPDLVASDLDGTLLTPDLEITPGLTDAIRGLRGAGVAFVICTGRMFRSARIIATRLGFEDGPIVCYQGALVADLATGQQFLHTRIEPSVAEDVVLRLRELGRHLNAYIDDQLFIEHMDEWARSYAEYAEVGIELVDDLAAEVRVHPPTKFVVLSDPADVDELLPGLQERWRDRLYVVRSQASYIEITDPRVSKSGALQWLCDRWGFRRSATVTCGDGHNDVDMLSWAGMGVAVAEAAPEVRRAADVVVPRAELPALLERLAAARA